MLDLPLTVLVFLVRCSTRVRSRPISPIPSQPSSSHRPTTHQRVISPIHFKPPDAVSSASSAPNRCPVPSTSMPSAHAPIPPNNSTSPPAPAIPSATLSPVVLDTIPPIASADIPPTPMPTITTNVVPPATNPVHSQSTPTGPPPSPIPPAMPATPVSSLAASQPGQASLRDALVDILHTLLDNQTLYFQYALSRDQTMQSLLQQFFHRLFGIATSTARIPFPTSPISS